MHRLAGPAAREQPARVGVRRGVHVVPVAGPAEQEIGDRSGDRGRWLTEPQEDLFAVVDHVVEGEADDAAERLCVEQDDGGGDPGPERQVMAGQEAAGLARSLVFRERCRLADHRGGQLEAPGEPTGHAARQPTASSSTPAATAGSTCPASTAPTAARPRTRSRSPARPRTTRASTPRNASSAVPSATQSPTTCGTTGTARASLRSSGPIRRASPAPPPRPGVPSPPSVVLPDTEPGRRGARTVRDFRLFRYDQHCHTFNVVPAEGGEP